MALKKKGTMQTSLKLFLQEIAELIGKRNIYVDGKQIKLN